MILSENDELNDIKVDFNQPVSAIFVNVNDHGYCKVRFDKKSVKGFEENLYVSFFVFIIILIEN